MSSSNEPATGSLSVIDLNAMDDAALAALMERHRQPNGAIELRVHDWDELSEGALEKLGQRLKADKTPILDLDQLDAHLRDIAGGHEQVSARDQPEIVERERRSCSRSTIMPDYEEGLRITREREVEAYNNLVEDGGRPGYPLELLDEVSGKPEEYSDTIKPWFEPFRPFMFYGRYQFETCEVFQKQWARWQDFRVWQRDNRCIGDEDSDGSPPDPDDIISLTTWARRRHQRVSCRELPHNEDGFPSYADAVKRRLARHGFTRAFQLKEDPNQQDEITTWIEYLNYEYFLLDFCTTRIADTFERLKSSREAWQYLIGRGIDGKTVGGIMISSRGFWSNFHRLRPS